MRGPLTLSFVFFAAGLLEIGGGYLVWLWLREGRHVAVGALGMALLAMYGVVPTFQPPEHPFGRVYAAYGAVFIVMSVIWGAVIDGQRPDARDLLGAAVALVGAAIMAAPR